MNIQPYFGRAASKINPRAGKIWVSHWAVDDCRGRPRRQQFTLHTRKQAGVVGDFVTLIECITIEVEGGRRSILCFGSFHEAPNSTIQIKSSKLE